MDERFGYPEPVPIPVPIEPVEIARTNSLNRWLGVIRLPFLSLSLVVVFLGTAMAWYSGYFNPALSLLTMLGLMSAHASVNVFNEYFDFRNGVDLHTNRTPFSGGSGTIPSGRIKAKQAFILGTFLLAVAAILGTYLILSSGIALVPIVVTGLLCIILYDPAILKMGWAEWAPGLGLGSLAILGTFYVQTGHLTWPVVFASIPSGILAHNLLLINEFPDIEADKAAGRVSLPIRLGPRAAAQIYGALASGAYLWIALSVGLGYVSKPGPMPVYCLLGLLTIPLALKAMKGAMHWREIKQIVPAMAANVIVVLLTQVLLGTGFILGRVLK
jgi:1,4-dihydroxy-2-naphthoate octaprenyltransferase